MKKVLIGGAVIVLGALIFSFALLPGSSSQATHSEAEKVKWHSWEEALSLNEKNPKKLFVDVYTDWCTWCKRMDALTFQDDQVAGVLNEHFYPIKLNAEQKEVILYQGRPLKFIPSGSRGVHELAYLLLEGQLGYPALVFLNEKGERITVSPGYKDAEAMLKELEYVAGDHYLTQSFEEYRRAGRLQQEQ